MPTMTRQEMFAAADLLLKQFQCKQVYPTGSTFFNGSGADVDFLVLVPPALADATAQFRQAGFLFGDGGYADDGRFVSMRKNQTNLIITDSFDWYHRSVIATQVCCLLKPAEKAQRIAVFELVRDDLIACRSTVCQS